MTHNTVYPVESDEASVLEGAVSGKSDRARLELQFPDSPLYTQYDPLEVFSNTVMSSQVVNTDGTPASVGYWGLNGYSRNYSQAETGIGSAPNISELWPNGDEPNLIGNSFTPAVISPSAPAGSLSTSQPTSETRAPFTGPSADDIDSQPSKTSVDIRAKTKEILETRQSLASSGIPSLATLIG